MEDSTDEVCIDIDIDIDMGPVRWKEYLVKTSKGLIFVSVCGDREKPALVTYPDVALNCMSCFEGLFSCQGASSLFLHNFCIYHIGAPGHQLGAVANSSNVPLLSVDDLADQVGEVLDFFGLKEVFCLGVVAGAYILMLFAIKYEKRVRGLILVSPICRAPSWTEWISIKLLLNLLYFPGMCGLLDEYLLHRYFYVELRRGKNGTEVDINKACQRLLDERQRLNILRFLQAINERRDLTKYLKMLQHKTLIFVGECSPFLEESMYMRTVMGKTFHTLVEVKLCGSLVTEEDPTAMLIPIEFFLMNFGFSRQKLSNGLSPLTHSCISPELLSPLGLGIKLKPIKTRPKTIHATS